MANQIITNYCCADCEFCFAADSRSRMLQADLNQMDEDEVRAWLDFTMASGIRELRLLGGEPTLHPGFADFVRIGLEKGCKIHVFSNGVMPDPAREALAALDPEICSVVININASVHSADRMRREECLKVLGKRVTPGITLTSARFSLQTPIDLINSFGLKKSIRIGLAHPTWRGKNRSLNPKHYPAAGQALFEQSFTASRYGIRLEADCGFVRCMFGSRLEQMEENGFRYISRCTPVLDLCTGGMILPCFALSNYIQVNRADFSHSGAAYSYLEERLRSLHAFGIFPECTHCPYFETDECCGGCLAARLRRLQPLEVEK